MGREIRMVPADWQHPRNTHGHFQPMHAQTFEQACAEWDGEKAKWDRGERPKYAADADYPYEEYAGERPDDPVYYRPWKDEDAVWVQVWETVSEGSPVTPPFATKAELVDYLTKCGDNWDQKRGDPPWPRKAAEQFVEAGWAPSMVMQDGKIYTASTGFPK